jgi:hypothetical protein
MKNILLLIIILVASVSLKAQARLTIKNNSMRSMTVKIMKGYGDGSLHQEVAISANNERTVYFSETGYYFTKTKAVLNGKEPVYQKGEPFRVVNDENGYSVMTLTFTIKESTIPQVLGGKQISKSEFDKN